MSNTASSAPARPLGRPLKGTEPRRATTIQCDMGHLAILDALAIAEGHGSRSEHYYQAMEDYIAKLKREGRLR